MPHPVIAGQEIKPGQTVRINMPMARLYTDTEMTMPLHIVRARKAGPTIFVSAAIHGDEVNGIEIIRRLIQKKSSHPKAGMVIYVPMVNVYGVLNQSRYLPDRRDLNRSFPGSAKGSLAGRLANQFLTEIVAHCDYGIDLHTGAIHRTNFPQIRANLKDPETEELAKAFGVPVLLNADLRDGSLRQSAVDSGQTKILLYEAGEALRFDELSIRAGVKGVTNVMRELGMLPKRKTTRKQHKEPFVADKSAWVRATTSGIVQDKRALGDFVKKGEILAEIGTPLGDVLETVCANKTGVIIGKQEIPLVQEGEAMFHIAYYDDSSEARAVEEHIEALQDELLPDDAGFEDSLED